MPRSFPLRNKWRLCFYALILIVPIFVVNNGADAQKRRPAQSKSTQTTPGAQDPQKKNLTRLNSSDTAEGSSITIFSDLPLNDYSAYRSGDRFYVLIPGADASRLVAGLRGRGFNDVRTQKRGNDVLVSFRLLAGATARVSQKFNRLEILITVPALVVANANASRNANTSTGTQTDPSRSTANTNTANANTGTGSTRSRTGSGGTSRRSRGSAYSSEGTTGTGESTVAENPSYNNPPDGIPVGPDGRVEQSTSTEFPPYTEASPLPSSSVTPTVDQIAQVQPTPGMPGTTSQAPDATTNTAPSSGSSFGAQVKQNWLFILLAIAVAGLIAWVLVARSRGERSQVESRLESIRESRAEPKAYPTPIKVKAKPVVEIPQPKVEPKLESTPTVAEELVAPAVVAAVVADETREEPVAEEIEEVRVEPEPEPEPAKPIEVEQASADVANLLAGSSYDESSISTEGAEARQIVAAELLAALAGRNVARHERAREAFVKHGYFEDATRTLRTAESPAERASAARSLGLVRDDSGTPHLVAALEDSSPEVRRAAVESLAEIRDPAAVAPLEALRDREKNRKVPTALIQHAIEASVVGRTKVEAPARHTPSFATTPLEADYPIGPEPAIEVVLPAPEEISTQVPETTEPLTPVELDEEALVEAPTSEREPTPVEVAGADVLESETEPLTYGEVALDEPVEMETSTTVEVQTHELADSTLEEWVDVDVSRKPRLDDSVAPPSVPVEQVEEVLVDGSTTDAAITETLDEQIELAEVTEPLATEPPSLPFVVTAELVAVEALAGDERGLDVAGASDKEIEVVAGERGEVSAEILRRLASEDDSERAAAVEELGGLGGEDSFREVSASFDDPSPEVRDAAARALFSLNPDRAGSFTRALREATPERRRNIGSALSSSGLATEAIGHLMGESREKTYDAFSLLFLMAKAGEVQPLMRAVEEHPNNEVRLAVVKLLALSGQQEILPAFRRLAVRGSLPTEVRSAVMEAIYQISSQSSGASS